MKTATIRDLRNHGGEIVDLVMGGMCIVITRGGKPVAELQPLRRPPTKAAALVERWSHLPHVDAAKFREDVDSIIDQRI